LLIDCFFQMQLQTSKILYFNYPSNPTAATAREFFEEIVAFAENTKFCWFMTCVTPS